LAGAKIKEVDVCLLGIAMYGAKYGKDYAESEDEEDDAVSVQVEVGSVKSG
jgi:hypothetical protein